MAAAAPARTPIAVLMHDGFYGCGTGAGHSNRSLLQQLLAHAPAETQFVVMPIRLDHTSSEYNRDWHAATQAALAGTNSTVEPLDNGTNGQVRFGDLANFHHVAEDAARQLHRRFPRNQPEPWIVALDVPFFGLGGLLRTELARRLVVVPRSTARIHAPEDVGRVAWESGALRTATDRGARVAAISDFMRRHLQAAYSIDADQILDLPNGLVDTDWLPPASPPPRLPAAARTGFMLSMGRATPYKGFDDLLDALAVLRAQGVLLPHTVLAAVTDSPERTGYQRHLDRRIRAEQLAVSLITAFTPAVRGLLWHPALAAVVVPSRVEPFGRIPLEAHAAGAAPVVATTAGGLGDQVIDGITGYTSTPNDPASLAAAIRRALGLGTAQRRAMRNLARHDTRRRFNYSATVKRFVHELASPNS